MTVYPDGDPETNSVDGMVAEGTDNQTWATKHDAATGDEADPTAAELACQISAGTNVNTWLRIRRIFLLFLTSALGAGADITAATLSVVGVGKEDNLGGSGAVRLVTSSPASNTNLVTADYDQLGTTAQTDTDPTIAGITADSATFTDFTLNATGIASISKTGVTKFGLRITKDATNTEPTYEGTNNASRVTWEMAEEIVAGDKRPKLVITYTVPSAAMMIVND